MSAADRLAWACAQAEFTGVPAPLPDGSTVELVPVQQVLTCREQAERVARKHGIPTPDALVPVQTFACGVTRNHWRHMTQGETA